MPGVRKGPYPDRNMWAGMIDTARVTTGSAVILSQGVGMPRQNWARDSIGGGRLVWLLMGLVCWEAALGVTDSAPPSERDILARIEAVQGDKALVEDQREATIAEYRRALGHLREIQPQRDRARTLEQEATLAPQRVREIELRLERQMLTPLPDSRASYEELTRQFSEAQTDLNAARVRADEVAREVEDMARAPLALRETVIKVRAARQNAAEQLAKLENVQQPAMIRQAREIALRAELVARDAETEALDAALQTVEARTSLVAARRKLADADVERASDQVAQLQGLLSGKRHAIAERVREMARQFADEAQGQPELIAAEMRANADLATRLAALIDELDGAMEEQAHLRLLIKEISELRRTAADQLEIARLGGSLGQVLHRQRLQLPNLLLHRKGSRQRSEAIALARFEQLELRARNKERENPEQRVTEVIGTLPPTEQDAVRAGLREQVGRGNALLERFDSTFTTYITELGTVDQLQRQLSDLVTEYATLLERNLVWIADTRPPTWSWPFATMSAALAVVSPARWLELGAAFGRGCAEAPLIPALGIFVFSLMIYYRKYLGERLALRAEVVGDIDRDDLSVTPEALLIALVLALPLPLMLATAAAILRSSGAEGSLPEALGSGLQPAAWVALALELARVLCRDGGVLDQHLRWRADARRVLVKPLRWLLPIQVLSVLVMETTNAFGQYLDTLGRSAFVLSAITLALFLWRGLHPEHGALAAYFVGSHRHGWQWNLRKLWFNALVLLPLALAVLALAGYYFTAQQLLNRLCATGVLVALTVLGMQLLLRELGITQSRLARQQALARRDAELEAAARKAGASQEIKGEATVEIPTVQPVDLGTVNAQVRALLRIALVLTLGVGFWWIWSDMLPALGALQDVVLWQYLSGTGDSQVLAALTAAGVGLALLVTVVTYLAARNLPGLLEVVVLQRLEVDRGARYAANAVSRYLIIVVGVLLVVNILGLEWNRLQWLIAALGVGLGFGLQEVVANFVSGLIILFERPFRIGDTVTVGSVSGTVTRIQIRATTITDWDRKELIVPNKTFITDQLVNWTLNDPVLRVVVSVGIAYGSDTELARRLLMEIAEANPRVLKDPPPQVWFLRFGDSSLNFEVRVFVCGLTELLPVTHELHVAIDAAFQAHRVAIAFPQRDLHLRSLDPQVLELLRGGPPASTPGVAS
jgi:potassium efflux system protein